MNRAHFLRSALAAAFASVTGFAAAQQPGSIKVLVGFPAGGPVDVIARAFAEHLRQAGGATVIVENRAGASGKIAIDALLSAPTDGTTLLVAPSSLVELVPMVVPSAKYDAVRDFTPLGSLAEYGWAVAAGPLSGTKTIAAYKEWAKAHPGKSSFATPGLGSPQHFLGSQLKTQLGIELNHVPYRGGAAAITDVIGGQLPLLISTEQLLVPYEGEGKLKTLFTTSRHRNPLMPAVPTAREAGLPQLEADDWFGVFVRTGTPADKVQAWKTQLAQVVASAGYKEAMKKLGYVAPDKQPADLPKQMRAERAAWAERVKLSGFKPTE